MQVDAPPIIAQSPPRRRKSRWWLYLLIGFGSMVALAIIAVVALFGYYHSLIKRYTVTHPPSLAQVEVSPAAQDAVRIRWHTFWFAVNHDQPIPPLRLTADDLNLLIVGEPKLKDSVRMQIVGDKLQASFMVPLDQIKKPELKGRYLNGVATLKLQLEDGFLTLHAESVNANGQPIPGWLLPRLQKLNILQDLEKNHDVLDFLQKMATVEVRDGCVVFTPVKKS